MIIDFHTHTFPDESSEKIVNHLAHTGCIPPHTDGSVIGLFSSMKEADIDYSVNLPVMTKPGQVEKVNSSLIMQKEYLLDMKIITFGGMHPDYVNYKEELLRLKQAGIPGIKLHPAYQNVDLDDIRMMRIIDEASSQGLITLVHAGIDIGIYDHNYSSVAHILKLLKEKYDIEEEDFVSAEIEVVPSGKARDYGLDRSMVAGYGHDDRVCAYTSLTAILDSNVSEYTSCAILVDKEEIGSVGATGAHSLFFENTVAELLLKMGIDSFVQTRLTMSRSKMLSSDVSAGVDPLFVNVNDKKNAAYLGNGIVFNKYTGSRGKSGSNDASAEYVAQVRAVMDNANIHYQTAELGRVDQGGGGTIAYILGNYNMDVIDAGIAVLNMHAPMEIVSKVDVYETYQAYKAFLKDA